MAEGRTTLLGYFNTGDKPTEAQFASLINSTPNIVDDFGGYESKIYVTDVVVSGVEQNITVLEVGNNVFCAESISFVVISVTGTPSSFTSININETGNIVYADIISLVVYNFEETGNNLPIINGNVIINAGTLPTGVTALTVRVVIKGFLIPKT